MADPSLNDIKEAIADQIRDALDGTVTELQVEPRLVVNPSPPCVDMYPAEEFLEQTAMGYRNREVAFTVRARVVGDHDAQQDWLVALMDPRSSESVIAALGSSLSVNGSTLSLAVEGPSGFRQYVDAGGQGSLLGCEWRTRVEL